ncbi:MAG: ABC transporter permease [Anaerolineales bacterium]|nr:ABC transporter permease [Anaerolineales bacterium]
MLTLTLESDTIDGEYQVPGIPKEKTPFQLAFRRFGHNWIAIAAFILMILIVLSAIFANRITTFDPIKLNAKARLTAPNSEYWFGTDAMGRDVFTRIMYGGRVSLWIGLSAVILSLVIGVPLGLISGYTGGVVDNLIMRFMDLILAFPGILFAIWLVSMLGPGVNQVIIAIAFWDLPGFSRVVRGSVLSIKEIDYIQASRALGGNPWRIMFSHVLPNVIAPIIIMASLSISGSILAGSSLSFLGLGAQPPTSEWGLMLSDGRPYLRQAWWLMVFPGAMITLFVLASNIFGDGLRDALDPRTEIK